jgi:hypothetical protein
MAHVGVGGYAGNPITAGHAAVGAFSLVAALDWYGVGGGGER